MDKKLVIGILAHVDAGKTTLSESMLYQSGSIRKLGRVDKGDAFLDTYQLERDRGITIFSKQAQLSIGDLKITLLDTPGHVDFSAEMERTISVLDYAVLVISGTDGVQSHTETLWRLLARYRVPVFLFINKMDLTGAARKERLLEIRRRLGDGCIDFSADADEAALLENAALTPAAGHAGLLSEKTVARFSAICLVSTVKHWLESPRTASVDELVDAYLYLVSHSAWM